MNELSHTFHEVKSTSLAMDRWNRVIPRTETSTVSDSWNFESQSIIFINLIKTSISFISDAGDFESIELSIKRQVEIFGSYPKLARAFLRIPTVSDAT